MKNQKKLYELLTKFKQGEKLSRYHCKQLVRDGYLSEEKVKAAKKGRPVHVYNLTAMADSFINTYVATTQPVV